MSEGSRRKEGKEEKLWNGGREGGRTEGKSGNWGTGLERREKRFVKGTWKRYDLGGWGVARCSR